MLCWCCLEILCNFLTGGPNFHFALVILNMGFCSAEPGPGYFLTTISHLLKMQACGISPSPKKVPSCVFRLILSFLQGLRCVWGGIELRGNSRTEPHPWFSFMTSFPLPSFPPYSSPPHIQPHHSLQSGCPQSLLFPLTSAQGSPHPVCSGSSYSRSSELFAFPHLLQEVLPWPFQVELRVLSFWSEVSSTSWARELEFFFTPLSW